MDDKSEVSYDDTSKMKTLDNCIKEAMRLYPAAPLIGRRCVKEDKIGPYVIPANTELFIDLGSLFRSEERWKDPDEYNPDRFNEKGIFWLFFSVEILKAEMHSAVCFPCVPRHFFVHAQRIYWKPF